MLHTLQYINFLDGLVDLHEREYQQLVQHKPDDPELASLHRSMAAWLAHSTADKLLSLVFIAIFIAKKVIDNPQLESVVGTRMNEMDGVGKQSDLTGMYKRLDRFHPKGGSPDETKIFLLRMTK